MGDPCITLQTELTETHFCVSWNTFFPAFLSSIVVFVKMILTLLNKEDSLANTVCLVFLRWRLTRYQSLSFTFSIVKSVDFFSFALNYWFSYVRHLNGPWYRYSKEVSHGMVFFYHTTAVDCYFIRRKAWIRWNYEMDGCTHFSVFKCGIWGHT